METNRRLRTANLVVGGVLLGQVVLMLALSNDLALPVTAAWPTGDPVRTLEPVVPHQLVSIRVGDAVAAFLLLAAADHFLVASPSLVKTYERQIAIGQNLFRWVEYSVSASIMMGLIALFVGIRDLAGIVGVFGLNTAMILFGLLMELQQEPGDADWTAFWFGSLAGVVPWALVAVYLFSGPTAPGFVYAIAASQFVLFASFALNMALQYARVGRWRSYVFGEGCYIALSVTAKSLLAWIIFANVLRA